MVLGGIVKGAIGFGLPLVTVPIMTFVVAPQSAIALMAVPIVGSNLLQAAEGGEWRRGLRRFGPMILTTFLGMAIGLSVLAGASGALLDLAMGLTVLSVAAVQLAGLRLPRPAPERERATSAAVGLGAGVIGGMTSFFGPLVITYLIALDLPKNMFVSTMAAYYVSAVVPFFLSLAVIGVLGPVEFVLSAAAMAPILVGLRLGTALRGRIPADTFRRIVLLALGAVGAMLALKALAAM